MNPKKSNNVLQISIAQVCGVQPLRYTSTFGVLVFQICSCCSGRERINIPEETQQLWKLYTNKTAAQQVAAREIHLVFQPKQTENVPYFGCGIKKTWK